MWMTFKLDDGRSVEVWCEKDGCKWLIESETDLSIEEYRRLEAELAGDEIDAAEMRMENR